MYTTPASGGGAAAGVHGSVLYYVLGTIRMSSRVTFCRMELCLKRHMECREIIYKIRQV